MKFTIKGGINIIISEKSTNNSITLRFEVHDTGIGISKADLKRSLFKMFGTIEKHRSYFNQHGTGIGLMVSK